MAEITLKSVTKLFDKAFTAVWEVDMTVKSGEFFGIVGQSGAGKTEILRMIAGLDDVTGGEIYFDNERVDELEPSRRDVVMVNGGYLLYPNKTVRQNLEYGLKIRKVKKEEISSRVKEAARDMNLTELLSARARSLTPKQAVRAALARVVVRKPQVALLDDPFLALEGKEAEETARLARDICKRTGVTFIFASIFPSLPMTLCDRVAVLRSGWLVDLASPAELLSNPTHEYTSAYLADLK